MPKVSVTNEEAKNAMPALGILASKEIPVGGARRVLRLIRVLTPEVQDSEKIRQRLLDEFCEHTEDGKRVLNKVPVRDEDGNVQMVDAAHFEPEKRAAFEDQLRELYGSKFEAPFALTSKDLGTQVEIKASLLLQLGPLWGDDESMA
jgi:hypothetical protein